MRTQQLFHIILLTLKSTKMKIKAIAVGLALAIAGCYDAPATPLLNPSFAAAPAYISPPQESSKEKEKIDEKIISLEKAYGINIEVDENLRENTRNIYHFLTHLEQAIAATHSPLLNSINRINITKEVCDPRSYQCETRNPIFYNKGNGIIKISPLKPFDTTILNHTLAHIYLSRIPEFADLWNKACAIESYNRDFQTWRESSSRKPKNGFLSPLDTEVSHIWLENEEWITTWNEDPPHYIETIASGDHRLFEQADKDDERISYKLDLLLEYDAISSEQHRDISHLLGNQIQN